MKLFEKTGKMALGSRLRLLTATVTENAAQIYELYKVEFSPKWFPVFFVLSEEGEKTITEIANEIGHSQPSVTKIIQEMTVAGLVQENLESKDKRRNVVGLTQKGTMLSEKIRVQCTDVDAAIEGIITEATHTTSGKRLKNGNFCWNKSRCSDEYRNKRNCVKVKTSRLWNTNPNINQPLNRSMKNGFPLTLKWKKRITKHWIIQKNTFWTKAGRFSLRYTTMNPLEFAHSSK